LVFQSCTPELLVWAGEELGDVLEFVHGDCFPVLKGLRQVPAIFVLESLHLIRVGEQVLADIQQDHIALLRQTPQLIRAIGIDHVTVDDYRIVPLDVEFRIVFDQVADFDNPLRLGKGAQPLAVADNQVVLLRFGGQRRSSFLEQRGERRLLESEGYIVAILLLGVLGEQGAHVHTETAGHPTADTDNGHLNLLSLERVFLGRRLGITQRHG